MKSCSVNKYIQVTTDTLWKKRLVHFLCVILYDDDYLSDSSDYDYGGNDDINSNYKLRIVQNYFATNWSIGEGCKLLQCVLENSTFMAVHTYPFVRPHLSYVTCFAVWTSWSDVLSSHSLYHK